MISALAWNVFFPIAANFPAVTRVVQVLTLLGALGTLPALWNLLRRKLRGWPAILGSTLLLLASLFLGWFGFTFHIFSGILATDFRLKQESHLESRMRLH
ncbi:hypothetical membrane protein [Renibacterium salmoninarum ATCC 33209]|uniref:Hypothetical membrane protein n=1 Tax=Renibacterium salmoninarum (strain ATCC 33209 / DSM 20767 / JCM 11484 / NBRC 15589 / NCIMB 2235) TaxID=288705 RepID=A9WLJ2_RENSM|nr:hypothetical membrane protein [Renibacterium salmoninarum ATCC 33209]